MSLFKDIFTKRFLTRIKKNYPSLFFCFFLILGQFVAFYLIRYQNIYLILFINLIFIFFVLIKKYIFINFFIIGILSFFLQAKSLNFKTYTEDASYLVKIISDIQNRVSNRISFTVEVLGVQEKRQRGFKELSFKKENFLMYCGAVYLPWKNISEAKKGDALIIKAKVKNVEPTFNPISYELYLLRKSISKTCDIKFAKIIKKRNDNSLSLRLNKKIRNNVVKVLGDKESSGLFLSMTIGVRNLLATLTEEKFKKVGLTHLLVVSGYQVCLIYFSILFILKQISRIFKKLYYYYFIQYVYKILALSGSIFFVLLSGADSSSIRAGIAIIILNIATMFERNSSFANSIILSFFIMHLLFPLCILDPGVALSYAALIGIWLGSFSKNRIKSFLLISFYVYIATSTVTLIWFKQISFISFLLNISVAPIISWISCFLGFLGIFLNFTIDKPGICIKMRIFYFRFI
ncbi:MAG: ComEC/Rec2 family competence protein [Bdellovibrionota bacterium]